MLSISIEQELVEIWKQLLRGVQQGIWYALITTDDFGCNLQAATNLNALEYDTLLLSSGIRVKTRRGLFGISTDALNYLQSQLLGQCAINNTRAKLPNVEKQRFFISIGTAHSKTPQQQATTYKALNRPRVKRRSDD